MMLYFKVWRGTERPAHEGYVTSDGDYGLQLIHGKAWRWGKMRTCWMLWFLIPKLKKSRKLEVGPFSISILGAVGYTRPINPFVQG
jgi:hypothetical protein